MDTTLNKDQLVRIAKGIRPGSLADFYSKPENIEAFKDWKAKKEEKEAKKNASTSK